MARIIFGIDPVLPFNKQNIEIALTMEGVLSATADPTVHQVAVDYDPTLVDQIEMQWAIQGIGFRPFVLGASLDSDD